MGPFEGYKYNLDWLFLSPRIGLNYALKPETNAYTPNDDNIYDADDPGKVPQIQPLHRVSSGDPTVENERVYDLELGLSHRETTYRLGVNFFWMQFNNENLFEGGFDSLGREITINIDRAVHAGFELTGSVKPVNRLTVDGNFALNFNRISEYDTTLSYTVDSIYIDPVTQETVVVESTESAVIDYDGKTPPLFPAYLGNLNVDYQHHWYRVTWRARMVGRQYVELFNDEELSIDPYFTSSVTASFIWQDFLETGRLTLSLNIDNLFDNEYEVSGYGGNWASRDQGEPVRDQGEPVRVNSWAEYFVGPERSFYGQLRLELF
jgi:outer membrane receptor protein involved in Fe transport